MENNLIPATQYADNNGLQRITVRKRCQRGTLPGAVKIGRDWFVPADAVMTDTRVTSGKYVGSDYYRKYRKAKREAAEKPAE